MILILKFLYRFILYQLGSQILTLIFKPLYQFIPYYRISSEAEY